ncbi:MAG: hypothetical protein NUV61_02095, partial [Candidatus Azambacteria bacterium]|nr:hypothetical protein [Candidatus Azambacteria bacterium]
MNEREAEIISLSIGTSPSVIARDDFYPGWRPANRGELASFAKKYHPARWYPEIFGIGDNITPTIFGPHVPLFKALKRAVVSARYNPIRGLPQGTLVLFIKKDPNYFSGS